jgi:hypothetical protein
MPSAAIRIILARTTSKYGNVYLAARRFSSADSSADNLIRNGLFLGILRPSSKDRKDAIRGQTYPVIYVSVFMETPTKVPAQIHKGFGRWNSVCSAIVCWTLVAA